jgi:PBP1b-binding outer membrane lipoprotein LpoB
MKKIYSIMIISLFLFTGCSKNLSPFSPDIKNDINNQNGKIEDIKNNQNGVMLELIKLRNEQRIQAEKIENFQQGIFNGTNENFGVQILQGDGALVMVFALGTIAMILIYHYRTKSIKKEKAADILAQQIVNYNDESLTDGVFVSAMHTDVEKDVFELITKNQN